MLQQIRSKATSAARTLLFDVGALPYAILTAQPTWRTHGGKLADLCGLRAGQHVLDLGCGPGESAFGMLDRVPGLRVTGLDISATMIRFARLRRRFEREAERVEFVEGDAMNLAYPDATFDAVTGHSFLYLVPDATRVLSEVARVLKPGGTCAFLEPQDAPGPSPLPRAILRQTFRDPRFVTSMALWRIVSRGYGRFGEHRFSRAFADAGLELVRCQDALSGLGMFGVGRKPAGN
jgi:ubiquinone/menaquinone biosynthesis C-methylase UbiE